MKNLLSLYALTKSLTFWLFILLVIIGLSLPSSMMEGYGKFAAALILFSLGFEICRLFNINLVYYFVFTGIITVAIQPVIGIILLISALIFFSVIPKSDKEESNQEIAQKTIKRHNRRNKNNPNYKPIDINEADKITNHKNVRKVNPFVENVNIDEPVSPEPFIKIRDAIDKIGIENIKPENLFEKLNEIESLAGMKIFRKETTSLTTLKELHMALHHIDLDARESVTLQELFDVDENDALEYEKKYNPQPGRDYSDEQQEELGTVESAGIVAGTVAALNYLDKKNRINKKRAEVEKLNNEYKFERGFDPDFDEDEFLSSGIKDEEEYLDARKQELQQKNIVYDQYLSPDERNLYESDEN